MSDQFAAVAEMAKHRPDHLYPVRAERSTIGAIVARGADAMATIRSAVRADDYCDPASRAAFEALAELDRVGQLHSSGVNLLALWDAIQAAGKASLFRGGTKALQGLFLDDERMFGGDDGPRQAAMLVSRAAMLRRAEARAEQLMRSIRSHTNLADSLSGRELVDKAAAELSEISARSLSDDPTMHISLVCDEHDRVMEMRLSGQANLISYGIDSLDRLTDGADCDEGELVIIAARPSMGKTAMFGSIVRGQNVRRIDWRTPMVRDPHHFLKLWKPLDEPTPTLIASAEMTEIKLLDRQCGDLCSIDTKVIQLPIRFRAGDAAIAEDRERWRRIGPLVSTAKQFIRQWPVDYVTQPRIVEEIERQAKVWRNAHPVIGTDAQGKPLRGPGLMVVDHLGCIGLMGGKPKGMDDVEYIGHIVQRLKNLAKDLKVVVILLVQLNRSVESREGHRPVLSDMRGSGKIEEIADTAMFLFRPIYYGVEAESETRVWDAYFELLGRGVPEAELQKIEAKATHMEADVRKCRNGATGTAVMGFYRTFTRVVDKVRTAA